METLKEVLETLLAESQNFSTHAFHAFASIIVAPLIGRTIVIHSQDGDNDSFIGVKITLVDLAIEDGTMASMELHTTMTTGDRKQMEGNLKQFITYNGEELLFWKSEKANDTENRIVEIYIKD